MDRTTYEWVWRICSIRTEEKQCVPMRRGDRLYICVNKDGKALFRHRTGRSDKNTGLWNEATADYCTKKKTLTGNMPDGRTFTMRITQEEDYHRLTCEHRINPREGEWDADDRWDDD